MFFLNRLPTNVLLKTVGSIAIMDKEQQDGPVKLAKITYRPQWALFYNIKT